MSNANPSWNADLYDDKHNFVTQYGEDVLSLLKPLTGERILDIGCGTGHLTAKIAEVAAKVVGLDSDPTMIESAKATYPEIEFILADAAQWKTESPFDAAFSNAAFHWMPDLNLVFDRIYKNLKPGARFVFEMGGKDNVKVVVESLKVAIKEATGVEVSYLKNFLSIGQVAGLLEPIGFRIEAAFQFDRMTQLEGKDGLRTWYRQFATQMLAHVPEEVCEEVLVRAENLAEGTLRNGGVWFADYKRLRVQARKLG